jgi:hypothetical protein
MAAAGRLMQKLVAGSKVLQDSGGARQRPSRATAEQMEKARVALEAFLAAWTAAKSGASGADALDAARVGLLRALADALPIATAVPLLQAFLRSAALEVVAALRSGAADRALFERHGRALERARDEARALLAGGAPAGESFWEASI